MVSITEYLAYRRENRPDGVLFGTEEIARYLGLRVAEAEALIARRALPPTRTVPGYDGRDYRGLPLEDLKALQVLRGKNAIVAFLGVERGRVRHLWTSLRTFGIRSSCGDPLTTTRELEIWMATPDGAFRCAKLRITRVVAGERDGF